MKTINESGLTAMPTDGSPSDGTVTSRRRLAPRVQKLIRRAHLYLGLGLIPWVLLFGTSGFLFNHTDRFFGGPTRQLAAFSPTQTKELVELAPVNLAGVAAKIVEQLNSSNDETADAGYRLAQPTCVSLTANPRFQAEGDGGTVIVAIDPVNGGATVELNERKVAKSTPLPCADRKVVVADLSGDLLREQAAQLLAAANVNVKSPLTAGRRSPELRFQMTDAVGRKWNVSCDVGTGNLSGRATDDETGMGFHGAITRLHKTHHYPDQFGDRWIWVLIADVTALTLVFWGISGLVMWWQIKPTRVIGIGAISLAVMIAGMVFSGTLADYNFSPDRGRGGGKSAPQGEQDGDSRSSKRVKPGSTDRGVSGVNGEEAR